MAIYQPQQEPPEPPTTWKITGLRYLPLGAEFEVVTVQEFTDDGEARGKLVAASTKLSRLVEMVAPTQAKNL